MKVLHKETRIVEVVTDRLCDFCGKSVYEKVDDHSSVYTEINHRIVEHVGDEAIGEESLEIDCCPDCWETKLMPFFTSIKLKEKEYGEG